MNKNNRCHFCKKHIIITFNCRCGGQFCIKHRYTDSHNCNFDHTSFEREILRLNNPIVVKDKIVKRI